MSTLKGTTLTPYMPVENAATAIEFYKNAFGAEQKYCIKTPDGKIGHAELLIGDNAFMFADFCPEWGHQKNPKDGGSPMSIYLTVPDADATFAQALKAGATELMKPEDMFYGHRVSRIKDPFGYEWSIATVLEELSQDESQRRMDEMVAKSSKKAS